jgi:MoaA/NifB/PqqE/SkfB family radical SAM enzyme
MLSFSASFAEYLLRQNLQHVIVHVTNNCNFRCDHCFIDFSPKRDMKLEQYQELAKQMGKFFWLDIAGGEPFLRKDLAEIVAAFDAKVVQIPSNGSLPEQAIAQLKRMKELTNAEIAVSLSIDGLQAKHDRIRNHPGSWEQVWSTFEQLKQLGGISIKINTVLSQENAAEILDLMREVRRREPDFHSIILLRGDPMNPAFNLPTAEELHQLAPEIFAILETYDYGRNPFSAHLLRNYHKYLWNISLRTLKEQTQVIPCLAGKAHMVVWGNGEISSCEMLPSVGDIHSQTWAEILNSDRAQQQRQDIKAKKCHCTHNCAMFDSILFNPANTINLLHQKIS